MPIPGTVQFTLPIAPGATNDNNYMVESAFLKGSLRSVATIGERDYIMSNLSARGETGMIVHVNSEGKYYKLQQTSPVVWEEVISNAASAAAAQVRLATSSLTGVASFNTPDFVIGSTGHVTLSSVFTRGSTFNGAVSVGGTLTAHSLFVSQGATFGTISATNIVSSVNSLTGDLTLGAGSNITITPSGKTLTINAVTNIPVASNSVTGVASFNSSDFVVSSVGAVSLTDVFTGGATFNAAVSVAGSLTAQSIFVSQGATFNSRATFSAGLTSLGTVAAQSLSVDAGATFTSQARFVAGLSSGGTVAVQSLSVDAGATFNTVSATTYRNLPVTSLDGASGVASFRTGDFTVSTTGNVRLAQNIVRSLNGLTGTPSVASSDGSVVVTTSGSNVNLSARIASDSVTGVASFPTADFTIDAAGQVSLKNVPRTNTTNTFSQRQTFTVGITTGQLYVGGGATFASGIQGLNSALSVNNNRITDLAAPSAASDAATRAYVDNVAAGLNYHPNVKAATVTALRGTTVVYNNGPTPSTPGVGAFLEENSGTVGITLGSIDNVDIVVGNRVLVKDQPSLTHNGIYVVTRIGAAGSTGWLLTRASDSDNSVTGQVAGGDTVYVEAGGTTNGGAGFVLLGQSNASKVLGTDNIVWTQYTGVDTTQAGDGLGKSGNSLNVLVDNSTIEISSDQLRLKDSTNYARLNATSPFTALQTFNAGITTQSIYVSQGATFNSRATFAAGLTSLGTVTVHSLSVDAGATFNTVNATTYRNLPLATQAGATGIASFNTSDFVVSSAGQVSLTDVFSSGATFNAEVSIAGTLTASSLFVSQGATFNSRVAFVAGLSSNATIAAQSLSVAAGATFTSLARFAAGMSSGGTIAAHSLIVDNGATFTSRAAFVAGLSSNATVAAQSLSVASGATFTSRATFSAGLTSLGSIVGHSLSVDLGATFGSLATFVRGLSSAGIYSSAGSTFTGLVEMLANLTAANLYVSGGATFNSRVSFLDGLTAAGYTRLNELGVLGGATFGSDVLVNGRLHVEGDFYARRNAYVNEIAGGGTSGTLSATGGDVIWLPTGQLIKTFNHAVTGNASITHASGSVTITDHLGNARSVTCGYADLVVTVESGTGNNYSGGGKYTCRFNIATDGSTVNWNQYGAVSTGGLIANFDVVSGNGGAWHLIATPVGRSTTNPAVFRTYAIMTPSEGVFRVGNGGFNSPGGHEGGPPAPPPIWEREFLPDSVA